MFKSRFPILANLSLFFAGCILSLLLFASADDAELAALHYQKGQNFLKGKGENQSYPQAVMHFRLAAEMEHGGATARLAWLQDYLQNESSLKIRYRRTMQLAKENNAAAQFELGQMCEFGLGVEADIERAKNWYRQAAALNNQDAQTRMALFYVSGEIKDSSVDESINWLRIAAENNQAEAQLQLGNMYFTGVRLEKNLEQAFQWYERAAKNGHASAQLQTGLLLKEGKGVNRDYEKSLVWLEMALEQGLEDAREHVGKVNEILDDIFLENFKY